MDHRGARWIVALGLAVACTHPAAPPPPAPLENRVVPAVVPPPPLGELMGSAASRILAIDDRLYTLGWGPVMISRDRGATFAAWSESPRVCVQELAGARDQLYAIGAPCIHGDVQTSPDKLFRSSDGGSAWEVVGVTSAILRGVDARDPRVVYADDMCGSASRRLCRSDDAGSTWQPVAVPAPSAAYAMLSGSLFVADTGALYYTPPRDTSYELDRSDDRGATWHEVVHTSVPADIAIEAVEADGSMIGMDLDNCRIVRSARGEPFSVVFQPQTCEPGTSISGNGMFACAVLGDDVVIASRNAGATWQPLTLPPTKELRYACWATSDRVLVGAGDRLDGLSPPW